MVQMFIVSYSNWFEGKKIHCKRNVATLRFFAFTAAAIYHWLTQDNDWRRQSKHGFFDKFCQRYCYFSQINEWSYIVPCHCNIIISQNIYFFNLKLGKPKLHTTCMRKIYSAVQHSPQQIDQMKRYCILTVIFCFHFLRIKLSK